MTSRRGELTGMMLRALAAELSDPGRFRRASAYARNDAVLGLDVHPGLIRGLVRGSRFEPYETRLWVDAVPPQLVGQPVVPQRAEVWAECTCPDDDAFARSFCKHAIATLLVFADEVDSGPTLLARWRSDGAEVEDATAAPAPGRPSRPDADADADADADDDADDEREHIDLLASAVAAPAPIPALRPIPRRLPVAMSRQDELSELVADVLSDALASLRTG